jgi:hypothetical protein
MKRFATATLIVAWIIVRFASPVLAQHGASHGGGFSGHAGSSVHGGFSAPAARGGFGARPSTPPAAFQHLNITPAPHYNFAPQRYGSNVRPIYSTGRPIDARNFARGSQGNALNHSSYPDRSQHRRPYDPYRGRDGRFDRDGRRFPYIYSAWPAWYNPYPFGYGNYLDLDDGSYDDSSAAQANAPQQNAPQDYPEDGYGPPADQAGPALPPWPGPNAQQPAQQPAAPLQNSEAVTLVFNDGHPSEQIHNYLLTPGTLYVLDQHRREIPTNRIDMAATVKANREAGVDFKLPRASSQTAQ